MLHRHPDLEELQATGADLGRARERFLEAVRDSAEPSGERIEMAGAELLRQAVTAGHQLRRCLSVLMVAYALLWARVQRLAAAGIDEGEVDDELDDIDDEPGVRIQALDRMTEMLEVLIAAEGETSEGRSADGRVSADVNADMQLVEMDFDPCLLSDPAYRESVVEAVNDGVGPVYRLRYETSPALPPEPEPFEETPAVAGGTADEAPMGIFHALIAVDEVQLKLARLLPRVSRGVDPRIVADRADMLEEICRDAEESLREHLPSLPGYRALLSAKAWPAALMADDLAELAGVEELFLEVNLDKDPELEWFPGGDLDQEYRDLVAMVAHQLQKKDQRRKDRLFWQGTARRLRSQVAEVERQTFEGRSRDGLVTARATGSARLIDFEVDAGCDAEPARVKAAVLAAVNAALDKATHGRCMAMMLEP